MSDVVRCLRCGKDNRIPDVEPNRRGVFRCGGCREEIKSYAPREDDDEEYRFGRIKEEDGEMSSVLAGLCWTSSALLLVMMGSWSDPYYDAVRFVVFAASAFGFYLANRNRSDRWPWLFMLGSLTCLYIPLARLALDRVPWMMIDSGATIVLVAAPFYCRTYGEMKRRLPEMTEDEAVRHADRSVA